MIISILLLLLYICVLAFVYWLIIIVLEVIGIKVPTRLQRILAVIFLLIVIIFGWRVFKSNIILASNFPIKSPSVTVSPTKVIANSTYTLSWDFIGSGAIAVPQIIGITNEPMGPNLKGSMTRIAPTKPGTYTIKVGAIKGYNTPNIYASTVLTVIPSDITLSSTGFAIQSITMGQGFIVGNPWVDRPTSIKLNNGTLTYTFPNWTALVTPTQDADGIHWSMTFTNRGTIPSVLPTICLMSIGGAKQDYAWASSQSGPVSLSDAPGRSITIDDSGYPLTLQIMHTNQPGTNNVYLFPDGGGENKQYDLGIIPKPIAPGTSTSIHVSLRTGDDSVVNTAWVTKFPYSLKVSPDFHKLMLRGDMFQYDPTSVSPQGFQGGFDINSNAQKFDDWVMAYTVRNIATCKAANAGTWIEWDLEGRQGGQNYKGNPELIDVINSGWAHKDAKGIKLIDRFFKAFKDANIHVGVCLRPWTLKTDLTEDTTIGNVQSIQNHIDYCTKRWNLDVFYLDSPPVNQTAAFRTMMMARPNILLIPEYATDSWLQFSAPMVWKDVNLINWGVVPRHLYGNRGWAVYYHQQINGNDAKLGSTVLWDGWMGITPEIKTAMNLLKK